MSDLVRDQNCWFSHAKVYISDSDKINIFGKLCNLHLGSLSRTRDLMQ